MEPDSNFVNNNSDKSDADKKVQVFTIADESKDTKPFKDKIKVKEDISNNIDAEKKDSNIKINDNIVNRKSRSNLSNYVFILSFLALIVFSIYSLVLTRNTSNKSRTDSESTTYNEVNVDELSDFSQVCNGKKISNTTSDDNRLPRKTVLFIEETTVKGNYTVLPVNFNKDWQAITTSYLETQLVGCMKLETEVDTGIKCKLKDNNNQQINLPLYNAVYELVIYNAKTASKINSQQIAASGNICPTFVKYNQDDPKVYSEITGTSINNGIEKYVTQ